MLTLNRQELTLKYWRSEVRESEGGFETENRTASNLLVPPFSVHSLLMCLQQNSNAPFLTIHKQLSSSN